MKIDAAVSKTHGHSRDSAAVSFSGAAIELPRMPRTHNRVLMQSAMRKRRAAMRAESVHGINVPANIAQRIFPATR